METIWSETFHRLVRELEDQYGAQPRSVWRGAHMVWRRAGGQNRDQETAVREVMPALVEASARDGGLEEPSKARSGKVTTGRGSLPAKLDLEELRAQVIAREVIRAAELDPEVQSFRQDYFGAARKPEAWTQANELMRDWPVFPSAQEEERIRLEGLVRAAGRIAPRLRWTDEQAALFLLTGAGPVPPVLRSSLTVMLDPGPRATITVTAQAFCSGRRVEAAFAREQRELHGHRIGRPLAESSLRLFDFVANKEAELQRRLAAPEWTVVWTEWKKLVDGPLRQKARHNAGTWRRDGPARLRKDYERARRLLFPESYVAAFASRSRGAISIRTRPSGVALAEHLARAASDCSCDECRARREAKPRPVPQSRDAGR